MKSKGKVAVLMSAYNGEKYIGQQLDSVLGQTYEDIGIYVRDDGSTDHTVEVLKQYEKEGKLSLIRGKNKGFVKSYFSLLTQSGSAQYYAWCDQDDVWRERKLERAVACIREEEQKYPDLPILYFSDYDFYDENLRYIGKGLDYKKGPSFANAVMDCIPLGITCVFNRKARDMIMQNTPRYSCGQDWWVYLLCEGLGRVIYDRGFSSVKYRRLKTSLSPAGRGFWKFQEYRIRKFFFHGYFEKVRKQLREFSYYYNSGLKEEDRKLLSMFTGKHYSLRQRFTKTFYPHCFRQNAVDEFLLRILFLFGKL